MHWVRVFRWQIHCYNELTKYHPPGRRGKCQGTAARLLNREAGRVPTHKSMKTQLKSLKSGMAKHSKFVYFIRVTLSVIQ